VKNSFKAKKKYGQNFLINEGICNQIVKLENINSCNILEIGPGNMALSKKIIMEKPKKYFAVEIDKDLFKKHQENIISSYLLNEDALKINEFNLFNKQSFKIISNLPFNISSKLLIKWIKVQNDYNCIESMTLMFQKELSDRIIAQHNSTKYGRITILVGAFFNVEKKIFVHQKNFNPMPNVDAEVLQFTPHKKNKIRKNDFLKLEKITYDFFNERRKKNIKKIKKIFNENQISKYGLDKYFNMRPENLDKELYYKFSKIL